MCMVSYIGDSWRDTFPQRYPDYPNPINPGLPTPTVPFRYPSYPDPINPQPQPSYPLSGEPVYPTTITWPLPPIQDYVTKADFEKLKEEIKELKELLLAAKKYDEKTGQADCEMETKVAFMKAIAKMVDVDLNDVFPRKE